MRSTWVSSWTGAVRNLRGGEADMALFEGMRDLAFICMDEEQAAKLRALADDLEAAQTLGLEWPDLCPYWRKARKAYDAAMVAAP